MQFFIFIFVVQKLILIVEASENWSWSSCSSAFHGGWRLELCTASCYSASGFSVDFFFLSFSWTPREYIHKGVALTFPA
jgi:hypothetical protein